MPCPSDCSPPPTPAHLVAPLPPTRSISPECIFSIRTLLTRITAYAESLHPAVSTAARKSSIDTEASKSLGKDKRRGKSGHQPKNDDEGHGDDDDDPHQPDPRVLRERKDRLDREGVALWNRMTAIKHAELAPERRGDDDEEEGDDDAIRDARKLGPRQDLQSRLVAMGAFWEPIIGRTL